MRSYLSALVFCTLLAVSATTRSAEKSEPLRGVVTEAPALSKWVGSQVTFTGLESARPSMVWPDGYEVRLSKIFENENLLVLQFVATVGSTDTVYVERKNKRFLVVSVGAMAITDGNSATVSQYRGTIK